MLGERAERQAKDPYTSYALSTRSISSDKENKLVINNGYIQDQEASEDVQLRMYESVYYLCMGRRYGLSATDHKEGIAIGKSTLEARR